MKEPSALFPAPDQERLRWIESWAKGWRLSLKARYGDKNYYTELPLDVAVSMIEELAAALHDTNRALYLIADETMESGQEIADLIEKIRFDRSANATEARRG